MSDTVVKVLCDHGDWKSYAVPMDHTFRNTVIVHYAVSLHPMAEFAKELVRIGMSVSVPISAVPNGIVRFMA